MTIDTLGPLPPARADRGYTTDAIVPAHRTAAGAKADTTMTTTATTAASTATGSMDELKDAVGKLNASVHAQSVEFSIDEDSKRTVVKVVDVATKEIVRQMPTEEALQIAKSLDKAMGLLIRQQA